MTICQGMGQAQYQPSYRRLSPTDSRPGHKDRFSCVHILSFARFPDLRGTARALGPLPQVGMSFCGLRQGRGHRSRAALCQSHLLLACSLTRPRCACYRAGAEHVAGVAALVQLQRHRPVRRALRLALRPQLPLVREAQPVRAPPERPACYKQGPHLIQQSSAWRFESKGLERDSYLLGPLAVRWTTGVCRLQ